ncbi:MAG: hypothetical protein K6D38_09870 [Pseudobutyrivibrio sp.]|nr:hypothetical protein [Pseudobutyrivibrio sp.]
MQKTSVVSMMGLAQLIRDERGFCRKRALPVGACLGHTVNSCMTVI